MQCSKCKKEISGLEWNERPEKICRSCAGVAEAGPSQSQPSLITTPESHSPISNPQPVMGQVKIIDFDMPFGSMVSFMIKWAIASIPAFIILFILWFIVSTVLLGIFKG